MLLNHGSECPLCEYEMFDDILVNDDDCKVCSYNRETVFFSGDFKLRCLFTDLDDGRKQFVVDMMNSEE